MKIIKIKTVPKYKLVVTKEELKKMILQIIDDTFDELDHDHRILLETYRNIFVLKKNCKNSKKEIGGFIGYLFASDIDDFNKKYPDAKVSIKFVDNDYSLTILNKYIKY